MSLSESEISSDENIIRATTSTDWDAQKNRWSSQLFKGENISVSRLSILSIKELIKIFHQQLDKPKKTVIGAAEINVGRLQEIGRLQNIALTVVEKPENNNPAHAEIPQKISRSLAKKIIDELLFHKDKYID